MPLQTVNIGGYANDGTGDDLRTAFEKVNANFATLSSTVNIVDGVNVGTGAGVYAQKHLTQLEFKSLVSSDNSITFTSTATEVDLHATANVVGDTSPELGGDLALNGHYIKAIGGGGIESLIYGIDVKNIDSILSMLFAANNLVLDFGTILQPTGAPQYLRGYNVDMGFMLDPLQNNHLDFGSF